MIGTGRDLPAMPMWLPVLVAALLPAVPAAMAADIYKWVDEQGVVNYGEHAPPRRSVQVVSTERVPLTIYPATDPLAATPAADAGLPARVEELERELAQQRREQDSRAALAEAQRLERCRQERRVDCGEQLAATDDPAVLVVPRGRFWHPARRLSHAQPMWPAPPREPPRRARMKQLPSPGD